METPEETTSRATHHTARTVVLIVLVCTLIGAGAYGVYTYRTDVAALRTERNQTQAAFEILQKQHSETQSELATTKDALDAAEDREAELAEALREEEERNEEFEEQIEDIMGTVGTLDKLSKIDKELLQKYSKVYFLNEHYTPGKLVEIDDEYVASPDGLEFIHAEVASFLEDMLEDAEDDDIDLRIVSAYRSYDEQTALKGQYTVTYGSGANTFSADQGYSEHQLGTAIDLTTPDLGGGLTGFGGTEAFEWMEDNAHKYGFVLSYPEDNAYYIYEPWHWRFVGTDLAKDLHDDDVYFYDLNQREIDEYLIDLFD